AATSDEDSLDTILQELPRGLDATTAINIITKALQLEAIDAELIEKLIVLISDIIPTIEVSKQNRSLWKCIFTVVEHGKGYLVEPLVTSGILSARSDKLFIAAVKSGHEGIARATLHAGVDPHVLHGKGFIVAAGKGNLKLLKMLVDAKTVNQSELESALEGGNQAVPSPFDETLVACLNSACSGGPSHIDIVEYLLSIGAWLNCEQLINAPKYPGGSKVLTTLINAGINTAFIGKQALLTATNERNLPAFHTLIDVGISPNCFKGEIMTRVAETFNERDCPEAIEILNSAGADFNLAMPTALISICDRGITEAFDQLLKTNLDLSVVDGPRLFNQIAVSPSWYTREYTREYCKTLDGMVQRLLTLGLDLSTHHTAALRVLTYIITPGVDTFLFGTLLRLGYLRDQQLLNSLLIQAAILISTHFMESLFDAGADITSLEAANAFHIIVNRGHLDHARNMFKRGLKMIPQHFITVAEKGSESFVNLFVEFGIDIQVRANAALIRAVGNRHVKVVERLLALGVYILLAHQNNQILQ
ncbi:hypothetical protein HDU76_010495, partial [Blyttiomyces sp. JEL0837]